MQTLLKRAVKNNTRYYLVELFKNLFGGFTINIEYGSVKNQAPTGRKKFLFDSLDDAELKYMRILALKSHKGYI